MSTSDYCTLTGSGVDFDSNSFYVTFAAGEANKTVNIPVMCDKIVENTEGFNISLSVISNNPQVTAGRNTSFGTILDSTGK